MADDLNIMGEDFNIDNPTIVDANINSNLDTFNDASMPTENTMAQDEESIVGGVNLNESYPDMPGYDVETFESAIDFATEGMPNLEINQPFKDMIDAAAVDLNKYSFSVSPNNDLNELYPGRAGSDFNPFRQSSATPDFNTANGRKAFMFQTQDIVKKEFPNKNASGYQDPYYFGAKRYEMDRYYHHPRFSDLGFHPFANNEEYYQANSSKWDNFTRTRGQWAAMFGPAFTSGWRSIGDMISGSPFSSDMVGAQAMDDAMRIGRSGSGGARGFFNDLFLNSSYTVGIISSIALEELALFGAAAVQGGANPISDAALIGRTGINIGRAGKAFKSLFNLKTYTSASANMLFRLQQINTAKRFWAASRSNARALGNNLGTFFTPETLYQMKKIKTAAKAGDNMTQMAKGASMFGGFYRDLRAVNLAWSEAKMEGGLVEMEARDENYMEFKRMKGGEDLTKEEMDVAAGLAKGAGLTDQLINIPIIYLSNKIVLDGAMRGFKPLGRMMDESLSGPFGRILRNPKSVKKHFYDMGEGNKIINALGLDIFRKMYKAGATRSLKHLGSGGFRYLAANMAEGFQELAQEGTAVGVKSWYKGLYEQEVSSALDIQLAEMVDAYNSGTDAYLGDFRKADKMNQSVSIGDAISEGVASQISGQGLHTFMSGFLMGGMIQGPQKMLFQGMPNALRSVKDKVKGSTEMADYKKNKEEYIKKTVETLNKVYQDPSTFFDPKKLNLLTQKELNQKMMGASYGDNILEFMNDKDHAIFSAIYTVLQSNQLGAFKQQIDSFKTMDNQTIKEAFPDISSTPQKLRGRAEDMSNRIDQIEKAYNELNDDLINPFDRKKYKKGTTKHYAESLREVAYQNAKMMLMFSKDTFEQSTKRSNEIYQSLSSDPVLATISAGDIAALTSLKGLLTELDLLKDEVKVETDPKRKKIKEKKLQLLQDYYDIFTASENQTSKGGLILTDEKGKKITEGGVFDRRKIGKLKPVFVAYLKFLAEQNDDFVLNTKVDETLKKIVDYSFLKGRGQDYFKAMENLMNPQNMVELAERMSLIMKGVWEEHKKKNNQFLRLKKYVDQQERIEFLKNLADQDIQPDADQTKTFLEDGTMPTKYFDLDGQVTPQGDPRTWSKIEALQKNLRQMQGEKEAEVTEDDTSETELSGDEVTDEGGDIVVPSEDDPVSRMEKQAERLAALQAFLDSDSNTKKILDDKYQEYKNDWALSGTGSLLTENQWIRSKDGGAGILRSRYELSKMYEAESSTVRDEKTFEEWIDSNSKNPLLVGSNGLLTKNNVTHSDVSTSKTNQEGPKEDKFQANEKILNPTSKTGIYIVESKIIENDGSESKFYTVVDKDNNNTADKYSILDPKGNTIRKAYSNKKDALNAQKFIENNLPKKSTFNFGGLEFTTGDIVIDSAGKKWMVRTTANMLKNNNNLYLVPVDKSNAKKGDDDRVYKTEEQWKEEGWKKDLQQKPNLKGDNITRISTFQPVKFYPYQGSKVAPGTKLYDQGQQDNRTAEEAQEDFQEFLRTLTPLEMVNLRVVVERNPEYDKVQQEIKEGNFREYTTNPGYLNNPGLARGANEFEVTLMIGRKPVAKLVGMDNTILRDLDGSIIDGAKITQEQAERLFITGNDEFAAAKIRKRYAYANLINEDFKNKLGQSISGTFNLTDFPNVKFMISAGNIAFKNSKGQNYSTPWQDLDYNTINGQVYIYDIRTVYDKNGNPTLQTELITDIDTSEEQGVNKATDIQEEIDQALGTYIKNGNEVKSIEGLKMGRYVAAIKLPNGTITFVELKSDKLEAEQLNDVIFGTDGFLNQMQKTLDENFKDGKLKIATDNYNPDQFNNEYNEKVENQFYISLSSGEYLNLGVTKYGKLSVYYTNRITGQEYKIALSKDLMEGVNNIESFVQTINANWKVRQQEEKGKAKKANKEYNEIKLELTKDSFVNNIPKVITSPDTLVGIVSARIAPEIRNNIQSQFVYTDSAAVQAATSSVKPVEKVIVESKEDAVEVNPEAEELTDEIFTELLNTEFKEIPEGILIGIKEKIKLSGVETLTEQELLLLEGYEEINGTSILNEADVASLEAANKTNESGEQAESNNQNLIDTILSKEKELKKAKKEFTDTMRADLKEKGFGTKDINIKIRNARNEDVELKALQSEIDELRKNIGYKIVDNFDGQDAENIDAFVVWARENLPDFIQIQDIEDLGRRLKNNGITAGAFAIELSKLAGGMDLVGKIYTGKQNPFKYHEAFHSVFRMLLNESEIKKYLRIAKKEKLAELKKEGKTLNQALVELRDLSPVYQKMDRKELEDTLYEEYLADRFEEFKMNPRSAKTSSEVKSLFTRIVEWIKNLFLSYSPNELDILFDNINTGKYKSSEIASNRFTTSEFVNTQILDNKSGVTNVALKAIPLSRSFVERPVIINGAIQEKGKTVEIIKYFSQRDQRAMVGTIGAMYLNKIQNLGNDENFTGEYNPESLLKNTVDEYIEKYYFDNDIFTEREDYLDIEEELTEFYEGLENSVKDIRNAVRTYLTLFDIQIEDQIEELEQEDFSAEGIVKAADQWDTDVNQMGGFKSLSSEIRKFIATTTVRKTDRFGIEYDQPVDYVDAYNGLLKSLKNTKDPKSMIAKMEMFGQSNESTAAVVDRIYDEIGIGTLSSNDLISGNYNIKEISNPLFFQSIIKGFTQFRVDYIFAENDPVKGITNLYAANHKDDAHTQTDSWSQLYGTVFEELSKNKNQRNKVNLFLDGFGKVLNSIEFSNEKELNNKSVNLANKLEEYLGINLSPEYIKYSIISNLETLTPQQAGIKNAFAESEPITTEDIQEIKFSVSSHNYVDGAYGSNLFLNINDSVSDNDVAEDGSAIEGEEASGDIKNRIKRIARGNSFFDERVGNTVFLDPKGNLIYAHQQPTMHLEKVAELNSEDAIATLKDTDAFLETNYLLNNDKFKALVNQGKLRISRMIGSKMTNLEADENGNYKSNNSLDLNKKPGVSFGESSPAEFISNLINSYLLDYNAATGKTKTTTYQTTDEFGNAINQNFASALVDIKVIAESNTGDFVSLPIVKAVEKTSGKVKITDQYINNIFNEVETEYNKILRELGQTEGFTEETVDNYNDFESVDKIDDTNPTKHKAAKLFKTGELLTERVKPIVSLDRVTLKLGAAEAKALKGTTKILLKAGTWGSKLGIVEDKPVTIEIDGVEYTVTNRGNQNISDNNFETIVDELGSDISNQKSTVHKYEVKINDEVIGYTRTKDQKNFLLGTLDKNIIEIVPSTTVDVLEEEELITYETNDQAKRSLEDSARKGLTFEEALKEAKDSGINLKNLIRERLTQEFDEFNNVLNDIRAKTKIDKQLTSELRTSQGKINSNTKESMNLFNLLANEEKHNLMQWFFNDYLNTMSINQVLLGDVSMTLKDAVDEVKRAKAQNAAGPSAESIIPAPKYGVMHPVKDISVLPFRDALFQKKYSSTKGTGEKTDAQVYLTTKAFRYMTFGFGSLSAAQAKMIDKVEKGESISWEEFFGNKEEGTKGYKDLNSTMNSKKLVYADGKTFLKMSAIVLTPELTTDQEGNPLPNREELHNLRIKLERMEQEGNETIGIAVPNSASKMLKANVVETEDAFNDSVVEERNITHLDARWMRLQQLVPSNKIETVDPGQIKQLITSEQSDNVEVIVGGKKLSIGELRKLYNKTIGDRVELKYLNKRNLTFTFATAQDELQKSINTGLVTADLQAFLEYAKNGLESSQAKSQFLELFEVDDTGSPKYELNNPITIQKFQELFMSYFSKNVMREKQPGISSTLVSDKGMKTIKKVVALDEETGQPTRWEIIRTDDWKNLKNKPEIRFTRFTDETARTFSGMKVGDIYIDELRSNVMEYDSKGNPTGQRYSEFMIAPHFAEIMQNLKPGEPIPDVIAKAFATRIPSQDKHSAVNLKLVDFLPVFYGSSGVFPEDLIEISGADFDIDKVYMQIKEFYMKNGEFVEYGKSNNIDTMFDEYIDYQTKAANKKGTTLNEAVKVFKKRGSILDQADKDLSETITEKEVIGALRLLSLPVTKDEFNKYISSKDKAPYEGAQNNQILDQRFALLGNDGMSGPLFKRKLGINQEPAVLDPLTTVWEFIQEELPELANKVKEDGVIVDNALGKLKAWTNNKAGARSIGAVVLPNIVMNLLKENNVKIINKNDDGAPVLKIDINGHNYDTFGVNYEIDPKTGKQIKNGTRTQFVISALVTAMTDNAKERLAAKLGLNRDALAVVTNLVALGVGIQTAILLVNNPTLKNLYFLAENKENPMDPGISSLVKSTLKGYQESNSELFSEAQQTRVTDKIMIDLIKNNESDPIDINVIRDTISTLLLFQQAHKLKENTSKIQSLVTLISGMGRDTESIDRKSEDIKDLGIELSSKDFGKSNIPFDVRKIFKGNSLQARYYKIYKEFVDLTPAVFITRTEPFKKLTNLVVDNLSNFRIDSKNKNKIEKDVLSYLTGKAYMQSLLESGQGNLITSLSNSLIYDEFAEKGMSINDVLIRVRAYLKENNKSNFFVQSQLFNKSTSNGTNKSGINQVQLNTWSRLSDETLVDMQNSMIDLYQDLNTREDAIHLIHYLLVKDGLQYGPNTFLSAIPAPMLEQILSSAGRVQNLFKQQDLTDQNYRNVFGSTFNELAEDMVEGYLSSRSNAYYLNQISIGKVTKIGEVQDEVETTEQTSGVIVNTKKWNKDSPKENPDTAYVFTENINSIGDTRVGGGSAVIRNNPNAIGIITKKYYTYKENRTSENKEQWNANFEDNDSDFALFKKVNLEQFTKLNEFDSKIFPDSFANKLAAIPNRFALWLQNELETRYGLITKLNNKGTGLISVAGVEVSKVKDAEIKKISGKTIVLNNNDKTLTVDLMTLVNKPVDPKKYKGKKGVFNRRYIFNKQKFKRLNSNTQFIKSTGFKVIDKKLKGTNIKLVQFPMVITFTEGKGKDRKYRFFKLDQLFTPLTEIDKDGLFNVDESQNMGIGNKAVYTEINLLGSMQQNAMGGLYGPRTEYDVLQQSIQAQQPLTGINKIVYQAEQVAEKTAENIAEKMAASGIAEQHYGAKLNVEANENKVEVENDSGKSVDLSKVKEMSENNEDMHTGEETFVVPGVLPEGRRVSLETFKKRLALGDNDSTPGEYKKITEFYNNLTKLQKGRIASSRSEGGLELEDLEDIIKDLNNPNNQFTEEEYIEQMEKCYK
mgnify:CR=1 FL=1